MKNLEAIQKKYFKEDKKYIIQLESYCKDNPIDSKHDIVILFFLKKNDLLKYTDRYVDIQNLFNKKKIESIRFFTIELLNFNLRLRFTLSGLSAGEYQFLKLFSRLQNISTYKSTIILLDGFETAFHPEWQRKFLDTWIKFWEGGSYATKVQVILATHSPYIVSDLPKPCVAFLSRKEGEIESRVDDPEKHPATLGANLFELYQNAFFMKGALMGDLAKTKIDALFKVLSDPESKPEEVEPLKNTIRLVGEPLIRMKLWELHYLKTNVPSERAQLLAQRDYIQKRLKDLDNDSNQ
jgi:predicted ATPase